MSTPTPLGPARGLNVVHLFCHPAREIDAGALRKAIDDASEAGLQVVTAAILGAKADACFMVLGKNLWDVRKFQSKVQSAGFHVAESYVSVTEVSEYAAGMPEDMLNARLYPTLPPEGMNAFCFYPMSKRRGETHNWYGLGYDDRENLMRQHGAIGRTFRGRVVQLITGSTGLDDWEWGVTLFAVHVDDLKECVYTMRFDEASALYADFGAFYTGLVGTLDEVLDATLT
ncbi:MAG TPA: chlorite dismutase family protein [Acidimicrobiales bacterium]|jgi:chlorite dismutase|nr:chlorite dismutase family protein [Acidimicrobiales bacterium]